MMQISTPNAAYKIGSLVKKGYVEKIQSTTDRREYHLRPTQKYIDYYNISYSYLHTVVERARQRFTPEECAKLEQMLTIESATVEQLVTTGLTVTAALVNWWKNNSFTPEAIKADGYLEQLREKK